MTKALYGMLESALWFYQKLQKDLERNGFKVNPYNPNVANKIVNGKHMTVTWHVNNLKVSHKDKGKIKKFAAFLRQEYR